MHKRSEHLTVLTDIFSPDTAADGLEICPILPSPSFLSRQKSVPLKLRAPKTDYFCRDSLRTTREYRAYFKEDETGYRQKEPFSASGFDSLMHRVTVPIRTRSNAQKTHIYGVKAAYNMSYIISPLFLVSAHFYESPTLNRIIFSFFKAAERRNTGSISSFGNA